MENQEGLSLKGIANNPEPFFDDHRNDESVTITPKLNVRTCHFMILLVLRNVWILPFF